jgi:hypothetical protein
MACIEALGRIGGAREKKTLIKIRNRMQKTCSPELRSTINRTLSSFSL